MAQGPPAAVAHHHPHLLGPADQRQPGGDLGGDRGQFHAVTGVGDGQVRDHFIELVFPWRGPEAVGQPGGQRQEGVRRLGGDPQHPAPEPVHMVEDEVKGLDVLQALVELRQVVPR